MHVHVPMREVKTLGYLIGLPLDESEVLGFSSEVEYFLRYIVFNMTLGNINMRNEKISVNNTSYFRLLMGDYSLLPNAGKWIFIED